MGRILRQHPSVKGALSPPWRPSHAGAGMLQTWAKRAEPRNPPHASVPGRYNHGPSAEEALLLVLPFVWGGFTILAHSRSVGTGAGYWG